MTWHLKDRVLERKILRIDPNFCKRLHDVCESLIGDKEVDDDEKLSLFFFNDRQLFGTLTFERKNVEKLNDYDPKKWNDFPKTIPPEGIYMRIEDKNGDGFKAYYYDDEWRTNISDCLDFVPVRFRPWED